MRVSPSSGRGLGLRATKKLPRGVLVDAWEARVCLGIEEFNRFASELEGGPGSEGMLNRTWYDDGADEGLVATSIGAGPVQTWQRLNHSKGRQNVRVVRKPDVCGREAFCLMEATTTKAIKEGQELFLNYGIDDPSFLP